MFKHLFTILAALLPGAVFAAPLTTAFTYQGQLTDAGTPADAAYDFQFCVFDSLAGADLVSCDELKSNVPVTAGLFTVRLDFGTTFFLGQEQFLEIRVRPGGSAVAFTPLLPRQAITATPSALHALSVGNDAIGTGQIVDGTIAGTDLVAAAVNTSRIADVAVTNAKLGDNSVNSPKIIDGSVASIDLADGAVGLAQINTAQVQARVSGVCGGGQFLQSVNAAGGVACASPPASQGAAQGVFTVNSTAAAPDAGGADVVIGSDGLPVMCYVGSDGATFFHLHVAKCNDAACSGGDEALSEVDASSAITGGACRIAIGSDGFPVIGYFALDNALTTKLLRVAKCNDAACSGGDETLSTVDGPPTTFGTEEMDIGVAPDGMPVIAYRVGGLVALKFGRCNDAACSGGNEALLVLDDDPTDALGHDPTLVFGADGFPTIAHGNATNGTLRVVDCDDPSCDGGGETVNAVFDGASQITGFSIARGADGFPIMSFVDRSDDNVKLVKCNDVSCANNDELASTVIAEPNFGGSAIAVGSDGLPLIAIGTTDATRSAKCNDPACSGNDETHSVIDNPAFNLDGRVSMVLGADGLPILVYSDTTADPKVRVAKCGTRSCL